VKRLPRRLFVGVAVVWVAAAHVGPLLAMAWISFLGSYPDAPGATPVFGLRAYRAFVDGPGYLRALGHSLGMAMVATIIALALAWPLAWHVAVRVPRARRGARLALLVAPFWTSEVLRMFALVLLLSSRGAANTLLRWVGITGAPVPLLYGTGSVLIGIVYTVLLTMLLPLFATLDRLPRELLDAARDLGAGPWRVQWHVARPLAANGIASGVALTFLFSLGVIAAPALLGGAGTPAFATVIASFFADATGRWPVGAAFSLMLLAVGSACAGGLAFGARAACDPVAAKASANWHHPFPSPSREGRGEESKASGARIVSPPLVGLSREADQAGGGVR
jgi:spermidine/putrescine transport system permease protein